MDINTFIDNYNLDDKICSILDECYWLDNCGETAVEDFLERESLKYGITLDDGITDVDLSCYEVGLS